jgi:cyclic pyranopterin monophosphate synthase
LEGRKTVTSPVGESERGGSSGVPNPEECPEEHPVEGGGLTHLDPGGRRSRMVDVGGKAVTVRRAEARAFVRFPNGILGRVLEGGGVKGPIEEVARAAGLLAAKRTGDLIPMCHPLGLDHLEIVFDAVEENLLEIRCRSACQGRTGVEMEAMVGVSVAALTVYDMTKGLDHGIVIERVELLAKSGGRSGEWHA